MIRCSRTGPTLSAFVSVVCIALAACGGVQEAPLGLLSEPVEATARAANPISIALTVNDSSHYSIRSDGGGEYVHGQQTISAQIDGFGNLMISVATADSPARMLTFDYSAPADPANPFPATANGARWFKIKSNATNNGNPSIGAMTVGQAYCYNVTVAHGDGITQYQDTYNPAASTGSTYVTITRTSSGTWRMVTTPGCGGTANRAAVHTQDMTVRRGSLVFRGYWNLGFAMTFRTL